LHLGLPGGVFPLNFFTKTHSVPLLSPHTCYMPRSSHSSWFNHPNIWLGRQIMYFFVMYASK
jgi:hypothetical protein